MGFDTSNIPQWWIETHNNVKTAFGILVAFGIISIYHYSIILMTIWKPGAYTPERVKYITKPFLYF